MNYKQWIEEVDTLCEREWGLDAISLTGDWLSRDTFDEGLTPKEALWVVWETANEFHGMVPEPQQ